MYQLPIEIICFILSYVPRDDVIQFLNIMGLYRRMPRWFINNLNSIVNNKYQLYAHDVPLVFCKITPPIGKLVWLIKYWRYFHDPMLLLQRYEFMSIHKFLILSKCIESFWNEGFNYLIKKFSNKIFNLVSQIAIRVGNEYCINYDKITNIQLALHECVIHNRVEIFKKILSHYADNAYYPDLINRILESSNIDILKVLLQSGLDQQYKDLLARNAIVKSRLDILDCILQHGANLPDLECLLHYIDKDDLREFCQIIIKYAEEVFYENLEKWLVRCFEYGSSSKILILMEVGKLNFSSYDNCIIKNAIIYDCIDILQNITFDNNALLFAIDHCRCNIVEFILEDDSVNPYDLSGEIVSRMLEKRNINLIDTVVYSGKIDLSVNNNAILRYYIDSGDEEMVIKLLENEKVHSSFTLESLDNINIKLAPILLDYLPGVDKLDKIAKIISLRWY